MCGDSIAQPTSASFPPITIPVPVRSSRRSLGLPCITTAYDGSSECIRDGEHGFVIDSPESIDALANALEKLSDASTRRYMSEQATALGSFLSMRRHATEVFELYRDIAARRSLHNLAGSA